MDWKYVVAFLVLLWPAWQLLRVFAVAKILLGLRLGGSKAHQLAPSRIPRFLLQAAAGETGRLAQLGFKLSQGLRVENSAGPALERFVLDFAHPTEPIRALVRPHDSVQRIGECWIGFVTLRVDGPSIVTLAHSEVEIAKDATDLDVEVMFGADASVLLNRHRERVAAATQAGAWFLDANNRAVALHLQWLDEIGIQQSIAKGELAASDDGTFGFRFFPAFRVAFQALRADRKRVKQGGAALNKVSTSLVPPEALNEFDWRKYVSIGALSSGRMSTRAKLLLGVISLITFAAVLAWLYSPAAALALIVAVFVHELGHLAGMWMFGHRDTQMVFLPFFGAAAMAFDRRVLAPWKELVILFLGPLPGIAIGLLVLMFGGPIPWLHEAANTFVVLNLVNLAPVLPLDGGRILDVALLNRFPRLRLGFVIASGALLLLFGWIFNFTLAVVGLLMLLRIPTEWRTAQLVNEIRAEGSEGAEEEPVVRRVLWSLRAPDWAKTPVAQRFSLAQHLQALLRQPAAGVGTLLVALVLYLSPLMVFSGLKAVRGVRDFLRDDSTTAASRPIDPNAPMFIYAAAPRTPLELASADNAAVKFEEALVAYSLAAKRVSERDEAPNWSEVGKPALKLMREAARGKFFAVDPKTKAKLRHHIYQSMVVGLLVDEAQKEFRAGETARAQALIADTVSLLRLLRTAPMRWTASHDDAVVMPLVALLEEASARGETWDAPTRQALAVLFDEKSFVTYLRWAKPCEALAALEMFAGAAEEMHGDADSTLGKLLWKAAGAATEPDRHTIAEAHAKAFTVQKAIDAALAGRWPAPPKNNADDTPENNEAAELWGELQGVSAAIAHLRLTRAALEVLEARAKLGRTPAGFAEVATATWRGVPVHPQHGGVLSWSVDDGRAVLRFVAPEKPATPPANASATAKPKSDEESDEDDSGEEVALAWRLPKN